MDSGSKSLPESGTSGSQPSRLRRIGSELVLWLRMLTSAAVYATLIVTFGFQVARVEGRSTEPTLHDQVLAPAGYSAFAQRVGIPVIYAGQKLLFHGNVDLESVTIKWKDMAKRVVGCFAAVEVRSERRDKNRLILELDHIGRPVGFNVTGGCSRGRARSTLTISDIPTAVAPEELRTVVGLALLTPESYLQLHGIRFDRPPSDDPVSPITPRPPVIPPKVLLQIIASYPEDALRAKISGSVMIEIVVGADGRIHSPKVVKSLGFGLDEAALRVLPLWRFEPGQVSGAPAAMTTTTEMSFSMQ